MTVGPALEMWSRQTSNYQSDGLRTTVVLQRAFTVTLSSDDAIENAYSATGLPQVGDSYPGTSAVIMESSSIERVGPVFAIIICSYRGETGPLGDLSGNPTDTGYSIRWGVSVEDAEIDEDFNGEPIANKNDEPIAGIREKIYDDVVYITRNFLGVNRYALRAYRRAVNSDVFLGWPPGTARLIDDSSEAIFVNGAIAYWRVSAAIQFREPYRTTAAKAWWKRVRHEGFKVRDTAGATPHIAWDLGTKSPSTTPVLLKRDGTLADPLSTSFSGADWLEFQTLGSLPFNALGLI